jgi:hypothetical protein
MKINTHMHNSNNIKLTINTQNYLVLCISLLFAHFLSNLIPFDHVLVADRENYIKKSIVAEILILKYFKQGFLKLISNEPLYLYLNYLLVQFYDPKQVIKIIIFFSSFLTSFLVLKNNPKYFFILILFLFFPSLIFKFITHIRQGLAISIFLLGWFTVSKSLRSFLFILSVFIHSSFFIVLLIYYLGLIYEKLRLSISLKIITTVIFGILFSFSIKYIVEFFGARQAESFLFEIGNVSGLGFVLWSFILWIYLMQGNNFIKKHNFVLVNIIFYLSTYFFLDFTIRVFESILIIILLASLDLTAWRKQIFKLTFAIFFLFGWFLRLYEYNYFS